jgi:hypothetical protein
MQREAFIAGRDVAVRRLLLAPARPSPSTLARSASMRLTTFDPAGCFGRPLISPFAFFSIVATAAFLGIFFGRSSTLRAQC